jgi:CubicO group peptidase (beta-lactamase class C family)
MTKGLGACVLGLAVLAGLPAATVDSKVDAVFAKWTSTTPGCAVGVATNGTPVLAKGYGMADLEHDVKITPGSILEGGSVSKQFTAAAVMLLARDGKLSLDDQVRNYIPELPDYGSSLTIRHMLNHTSGLRDWGNIAGIAGWPRTTRVHTHGHVLEIVSKQKALNFTPGTRWSYSNTGFNLAAIIVERVSGKSFQEFTRARLFEPLGMTHTSWRDDYTQIVKGRALAYSERDGVYHTDMPFENVYGNGGLLTTVGDLLKWNQHYDAPVAADAAMIAEQQQAGHFNDGRTHGYALGLFVGTYKGLHEVYHSGSTAGYSAFVTRFPDQKVSVAVLCNATTAKATEYAHQVADLYLGDRVKPTETAASYTFTETDAKRFVGQWANLTNGVAVTISRGKDGGLLFGSTHVFPQSALKLLTSSGETLELDARGFRTTDQYGTVDEYGKERPATYSDAQLAAFAGTYLSDEAETVLTAVVENHALVLKRRPDTTITLTPTYQNAFTANHNLGTVIFDHDGLRVVQDRVWNLSFRRK